MKKSNLVIILCFVLIIAAVVSVMVFKKGDKAETEESLGTVAYAEEENIPTVGYDAQASESSDNKTAFVEAAPYEEKKKEYKTMPMDDALFIGDSRTVGLEEYGKIEGAQFFCDVGMSVYNIFDNAAKVPSVGKVKLDNLLNDHQYSKIYIMLGINEAGYKVSQTLERYAELIDFVKEKEPDAKIFIMANLHVSNAKSNDGGYITNTALNKLNEGICEIAQEKEVFYLDVNELFDDNKDSLDSSKTGDGVHLYAKNYVEWGQWIVDQSAQIWEENGF